MKKLLSLILVALAAVPAAPVFATSNVTWTDLSSAATGEMSGAITAGVTVLAILVAVAVGKSVFKKLAK